MSDVFARARAFEGEGRFAEALSEYGRLVGAGLSPSRALILRGLLHNQLGAYGRMVADLEHAQQVNPRNPYSLMWEGHIAKSMRRYHHAASRLQKAVVTTPPKFAAEMRVNLADICLLLDWLDIAAGLARTFPSDISGWWALAHRVALDRHQACRVSALASLRRRHAGPLAYADRLDLARQLFSLGRLSVADRLCQALIREAPLDFAPVELRARIIARRDGIHDATAFLYSAETVHGADVAWARATARTLHDAGRFEEAIALYQRSGAGLRDEELLSITGYAHVGLDEPERLAAFCRDWMRVAPYSVPAGGLLVTAFVSSTRHLPIATTVPAAARRLPIVHYWHDPVVPDDVRASLATWTRHNRELEATIFDVATAAAFIADRFGEQAKAAFAASPHPAMQADLFRLAFVAEMGGLYADADEACLAPMPALLRRMAEAELATVRSGEIPDFVHNYFLGGRSGSPTLQRAFAMAVDEIGLANREGRPIRIWDMTGPGVLTRALGLTLAERIETATPDEIVLIPQQQYRALVRVAEDLAYKQRPDGTWQLT